MDEHAVLRPSERRWTTRMTFGKWPVFVFLACALCPAQDTQCLPEIDTHLKLSSKIRILLQAKDDREGGDPQQFTFGPSVQFYFKPLLKLKNVTFFDLDDARKRMLVFESGYRIIAAPNTPATNRISNNVGSVKHLLSVLLRALRRARHFALVEDVPIQPRLARNQYSGRELSPTHASLRSQPRS